MATSKAIDASLFNVFRVFIIPAKQQMLEFFDSISKERALKEQFEILSSRSFTDLNNRHRLYSMTINKENEKTIFKYQIGKEGKKTLHKEVEARPAAYKAADLKLVDIIYLWERQILLVKKSFNYTDFEIITALRNYLQSHLRKNSVVINIDPIPTVVDFWKIMNNTREVFELNIEVNQLNINEGNERFREVLKQIKEASNDDSLTLKLKSKYGYLSINNPTIKGIIEYIAELGGKFRVKYKRQEAAKRAVYDSNDNIKGTRIEKPIDNITDEDVKKSMEDLDEENTEK